MSASAYYQRRTAAQSAREIQGERLLAVIRATHAKNYFAYGYRRIWKALTRAGEYASRCQVQRLMAADGIQCANRRGKPWRTTRTDRALLRSPDLSVKHGWAGSQEQIPLERIRVMRET